jgi:SulP family sulfate permease
MHNQPKYMMERIDIFPDLIPKNHILESFEEALKWIEENHII